NGEISEAEFAAFAAASQAELRAELHRLAEELSGYRETYDNALIEHAAVEAVASAAAQHGAAVRIAAAGQDEQRTLVLAQRNLAIAQTANHYGQTRTASAANLQYQRDLAAAGKLFAEAKADADADQAIAIH